MTTEIPEIAVDTSVLRELHVAGPRASAIRRLLELASAGKIKLVARREITDDVPNIRLANLPIKPVSSNPIELGIDVHRADPSVLRETTLGGERLEAQFADIQMLAGSRVPRSVALEPDAWRDWDHLHFHVVNGRRFFVTLDPRIQSVALDLGETFDVTVMTPEQAVARFVPRP